MFLFLFFSSFIISVLVKVVFLVSNARELCVLGVGQRVPVCSGSLL